MSIRRSLQYGQSPAGFLLIVATALISIFSGCQCDKSLNEHKAMLVKYHDSGAYDRDIRKVTSEAEKHLGKRRSAGGKLAIVLDVDDTAVSDWAYIAQYDFGFEQSSFDKWVQQGSAPAVKPVLELYRHATNLNYAVFFVSGRTENMRTATSLNLNKVGYEKWEALFLKPNDSKESTAVFKSGVRERLVKQGYQIVANLGDQDADLKGGYAEKCYKIPNPFY